MVQGSGHAQGEEGRSECQPSMLSAGTPWIRRGRCALVVRLQVPLGLQHGRAADARPVKGGVLFNHDELERLCKAADEGRAAEHAERFSNAARLTHTQATS